MILQAYKRALGVLLKKPIKLWGISLLGTLFTSLSSILFSGIPALSLSVNLLLSTSMVMVYLHGLRGEDVKVVHLFDCFKDWKTIKRVLFGMLWMTLWIFLWSLIPIVGFVFAIIKGYEYRLVPYILVYEQDIAITEATNVSKERTTGFKGQMFLSEFLTGVAIFVVSLVLTLFAAIPFIGILFGIVEFLFILAVIIFINLFLGLVKASFYELITEKVQNKQ